MKKVFITMTMLLALGMGMQAAGQKQGQKAQQELVDTTAQDALEAFSDTTGADTVVKANKRKVTVTTRTSPWTSRTTTYEVDEGENIPDFLFDSLVKNMGGFAGMWFVLSVLFILFVLAPIGIIIALFYFINKNRREKMKLAQMAMQQGQPIPNQLLEEKPADADNEYQKGMRQCFVGVGLMVFLGYAAGQVGFGIGALVFCIGLGKVFASKSAKKNDLNNGNDIIK